MIVRTTNDPAAWRDLGPWRPDPFIPDEAAVETRHLEPADLARVDRTPPGGPRRIAGVLGRREAEMAAARRRGSEATRRRYRG